MRSQSTQIGEQHWRFKKGFPGISTRNCPMCKCEITYASRHGMLQYEREKRLCRRCSKLGHKDSLETIEKRRLSNIGKHSMEFSDEWRAALSKSAAKRKHSDATKQKMREQRLGKGVPAFNPTACQRIDEYGQTHGYKFQHALNGGEVQVIGYSLDGYDKENNIVIEYYEKYHKRTVERDEERKNRIIQQLGCQFIELKEW